MRGSETLDSFVIGVLPGDMRSLLVFLDGGEKKA